MKHSSVWSLVTAAVFWTSAAFAADHGEAPGTAADPTADIADLYAWHTESDSLVAILTVSGGADVSAEANWDADVLYGVHIDTDGDVSNGAEVNVWARVGQNSDGEWGLQVENLPGAGSTLIGAIGDRLEGNTATAWAGLTDDPFFFDQGGFVATVTTGDLAFDASDDLACTNATAFVFEMDLTNDAFSGSTDLQVWGTTGRRPSVDE